MTIGMIFYVIAAFILFFGWYRVRDCPEPCCLGIVLHLTRPLAGRV